MAISTCHPLYPNSHLAGNGFQNHLCIRSLERDAHIPEFCMCDSLTTPHTSYDTFGYRCQLHFFFFFTLGRIFPGSFWGKQF